MIGMASTGHLGWTPMPANPSPSSSATAFTCILNHLNCQTYIMAPIQNIYYRISDIYLALVTAGRHFLRPLLSKTWQPSAVHIKRIWCVLHQTIACPSSAHCHKHTRNTMPVKYSHGNFEWCTQHERRMLPSDLI